MHWNKSPSSILIVRDGAIYFETGLPSQNEFCFVRASLLCRKNK